MITKDLGTQLYNTMRDQYNALGEEALYMSHFELAERLGHGLNDWIDFLSHPDVTEDRAIQLRILRKTEEAKLLRDLSTKKGAVGTAQLLSALAKLNETNPAKEGPCFIYTYIAPSQKELDNPNLRIEKDDPFIMP